MISDIAITADVAANIAAGLGLEVWLDGQLIHDIVPGTDTFTLSVALDDSADAEHELRFVLKNKTSLHTRVDEAGNILEDAVLTIDNVAFDNIKLGHIFYELTTYQHNFNGNGNEILDEFYGIMGCNGSVNLKFTTPVYLWLLENM